MKSLAERLALLDKAALVEANRLTEAERMEVATLTAQTVEGRRVLRTPLASEGSISPAQVGRFSQRQARKWQEDAQRCFVLREWLRCIRETDVVKAENERKARIEELQSRINGIDSYRRTLETVGVSGKTGRIRPTYKRLIEKQQAERAEYAAELQAIA